MEYGFKFENNDNIQIDQNFSKYIGWQETDYIKEYYSQKTVDMISNKISELLEGIDPNNKKIVVSNQNIINIMNSIENNYRPENGNIYTRYTMSNKNQQDYIKEMIEQTIEVITNNIKCSIEMEINNSKLSIWTTVLGDFNENGLRSHPPIKILNKRPNPMQFNMNY